MRSYCIRLLTCKILCSWRACVGAAHRSSFLSFSRAVPPIFSSSDVYGFGLLLYEMLHTEMAFSHMSSVQAALFAAEGGRPTPKLPPKFSKAVELLTRCWISNEHERPRMDLVFEELTTMRENLLGGR